MSILVLDENGDKYWCNEKGECHREDGPAIERINGDTSWFINDKCHRKDGPAIEYANGNKCWYYYGKLHREDGPAAEWNGSKYWYLDGEIIETKEEFERLIKLRMFW